MFPPCPDDHDVLPDNAYHWTPARQRAFLENLAVIGSVTAAAAHVGVSPRAAYNLRYRADGVLFALGWHAAILIARHRLTDMLLDRAMYGVEETTVRTPDGLGGSETSRRRYDGRLGLALLARLDRMAAAAAEPGGDPDEAVLARLIAQDFEGFLARLDPGSSDAAPRLLAASQAPAPAPTHGRSDDGDGGDNGDDNGGDDPADPVAPADRAAPASEHAATEQFRTIRAAVADHLSAGNRAAGPLAQLWAASGIHCELPQKSAPDARVRELEQALAEAEATADNLREKLDRADKIIQLKHAIETAELKELERFRRERDERAQAQTIDVLWDPAPAPLSMAQAAAEQRQRNQAQLAKLGL